MSREFSIDIDEHGFTERVQIVVRLDEPGDLDHWSVYPIFLDEHIELESYAAQLVRPDGTKKSIPRRKLEKQTSVGFGLYSSTFALLVEFPKLSTGDRIHLDITRRFTPSYPAHRLRLATASDQERLRVRVSSTVDNLRWRVSGWNDRFDIESGSHEIEIRGDHLEKLQPRAHEPDGSTWKPSLWLAWDEDGSWDGVASWYARLLDRHSTVPAGVAGLAATLAANEPDPRARLGAAVDYTKKTVRYEAVEIGEGSYIPSPSDVVLERGWGDCKDKSKLLVDLLTELGIPAHMVLIRAGRDAAVDPSFPTSLVFNHAIVAVPADDLPLTENDTVVDGFLFIDPTQDRGGALWLNPSIQGNLALVVDGSKAALVEIPIVTDAELSELTVEGAVDSIGALTGRASLRLTGERALPWVRGMDMLEPGRLDQVVRETFQLLLPGFTLRESSYEELPTAIPTVLLSTTFSSRSFVGRTGSSMRFRPSLDNPLPDSRALDDRARPIVVEPGLVRTLWIIEFPPNWCPVGEIDTVVRNDIGSFAHRVVQETEATVRIEAEVAIDRWWCPAGAADDLRELGVAAGRASRRSVRLRCPEVDEAAPK